MHKTWNNLELENLLDPRGIGNDASARPPVKIYLWPCVTLTFDFLIPKVNWFMSFPCGPLVPMHQDQFIRFPNIVFTSSVTDEETNKHAENIVLIWHGAGTKTWKSLDSIQSGTCKTALVTKKVSQWMLQLNWALVLLAVGNWDPSAAVMQTHIVNRRQCRKSRCQQCIDSRGLL